MHYDYGSEEQVHSMPAKDYLQGFFRAVALSLRACATRNLICTVCNSSLRETQFESLLPLNKGAYTG